MRLNKNFSKYMAAFFLAGFLPLAGLAAIKVSTLRVDFIPTDKQFQDVFIENAGDKVEYVDISLFKRLNPAKQPEQIETNAGQDPKKFGMVVTPNKMAINPGQMKRVRLLNFNHGNTTDIVYGLRILPVEAPVQRAEDAGDVHAAAQVQMVSSFVIGVYVLPANANVNLSLTRSGKDLSIENKGNTNALLDEGKQCTADAKPVCDDLEPVRIYGGELVHVSLPKDLPASYQATYLNTTKTFTSK